MLLYALFSEPDLKVLYFNQRTVLYSLFKYLLRNLMPERVVAACLCLVTHTDNT